MGKMTMIFSLFIVVIVISQASAQGAGGSGSCLDPCLRFQCPRGQRCVSQRVTCVRSPCCPVPNCVRANTGVKPGSCPAVLPGQGGICISECSSDGDCRGNLKCCSNGCGTTCEAPSSGGVKAGSCPRVRPGQFGICIDACRSDNSCPGVQKCCSNGCGRTCQIPRR